MAQRRGSLLFAHFGLSGPVILDVSRVVSGHATARSHCCSRSICSRPCRRRSSDEWLRTESLASGKKQLAVVLAQHVPRRLCETLLEQAGLAKDRKAAALTREERHRLVRCRQAAAHADHRHARLQESGGDRRRRGPGRSRFAHHAEQARRQSLFWPARFSISTAPSAATTSRPPGAPAGSRADRFDKLSICRPILMHRYRRPHDMPMCGAACAICGGPTVPCSP